MDAARCQRAFVFYTLGADMYIHKFEFASECTNTCTTGVEIAALLWLLLMRVYTAVAMHYTSLINGVPRHFSWQAASHHAACCFICSDGFLG
jgi:hypothetical protein